MTHINSRLKRLVAAVCTLIIMIGFVPVNTYSYAASKTVVVSSQKELEAALKSGGKTTIVIEGSDAVKYTVPKGKYTKATLVVDGDGVSVTIKKGAKLGTLVLAGDGIGISNSGTVSKIRTDINYKYEQPKDNGSSDKPEDAETGKAASKIGYVTKKQTKVESKYITFDIAPNIYVVPNLTEIADKIFEAMEKVTGLSVKKGKYYDNKIVCHVNREGAENDLVESVGWEMGGVDEFWIAPMDLFVENGYAFTHELGHTFNREFSGGFAGTVADEGFTTYTELKICEYLEKNDPDIAAIVCSDEAVKTNMSIDDYNAMYAQSIEYWMDHGEEAFEFCGNGLYGVGFRLMAYLDEQYGNYTKWFDEYDKTASAEAKKKGELTIDVLSDEVKHKLAASAFKKVYDKNVFKDFYKWMKKNEGGNLDPDYYKDTNLFKNVSEYTVYPTYYYFNNLTKIGRYENTEYSDLIVNIAPAEYYLRAYKGEDTSKLVLNVSEGVTVETYDKNGKMTGTFTQKEIPLKNVSYVKLVGTGTTVFSITGYNIYDNF